MPQQGPADHQDHAQQGAGQGRGDGRRPHDQMMGVDEEPPVVTESLDKMVTCSGEHAEDRERERGRPRHGDPSRRSSPRRLRRTADREVGHQGVELPVCPSRGRGFEPLLELIGCDPPLDRRLAQTLGDPVPI